MLRLVMTLPPVTIVIWHLIITRLRMRTLPLRSPNNNAVGMPPATTMLSQLARCSARLSTSSPGAQHRDERGAEGSTPTKECRVNKEASVDNQRNNDKSAVRRIYCGANSVDPEESLQTGFATTRTQTTTQHHHHHDQRRQLCCCDLRLRPTSTS